PQNLEEADDRLDSAIEVGDVEFLIGGVQIIVGKTHTHHDAGNLQVFLELGHDRNRTARANVYGVFPEDFVHGFHRGAREFVVGVHHARRSLAVHLDADLDALGRDLLHVLGVLLQDVVGVLLGHQPHRDFGRGARRNYGLCATSDEAAGHAVY